MWCAVRDGCSLGPFFMFIFYLFKIRFPLPRVYALAFSALERLFPHLSDRRLPLPPQTTAANCI